MTQKEKKKKKHEQDAHATKEPSLHSRHSFFAVFAFTDN